MEGESVQALRCIWFSLAVLLCTTSAFAQDSTSATRHSHFPNDPALFLEPNRFVLAKELNDPVLWLMAGFGRTVLDVGNVGLGVEGLIWSRLRTLSDFRFPVETADYFFGLYSTIPIRGMTDLRFRVSHISSHDVDGRDSVLVGGSSSHYSREFVELSAEQYVFPLLHITAGVKYIFHQVSKIEDAFQFPAAVRYQLFGNEVGQPSTYGSYAFVASDGGPVAHSLALGIALTMAAVESSEVDLQFMYRTGASWAGTDAGAKVKGFNLQLNVRDVAN